MRQRIRFIVLIFTLLLYSSPQDIFAVNTSCCVECLSDAHCDDGDECTVEYCDGDAKSCVGYSVADCPPDDPGKDHPDDNVDVSSPDIAPVVETDLPVDGDGQTHGIDPPIAILKNGFYNDLGKLATDLKHQVVLVSPGFDPAMVADYPFLAIPSAGLLGLEQSPRFRAELEQYAAAGGRVLVLAQQHGYEYAALPGDIEGYGWIEDQSCQYASVTLTSYAQVLASLSTSTPSFNEDGYLTAWPDNAHILLYRTKNGLPAMIEFPWGDGSFLVSGQYSDWAYTHYQSTREEVATLRDILAWNLKGEALPEYAPGELIKEDLEIPIQITGAASIELTVQDPSLATVDAQTFPLAVSQGEVATLSFELVLSSSAPLGIWTTRYALLDADGVPLVEGHVAQRFVVSQPPPEVTATRLLTYGVTSDRTHYLRGDLGKFRIDVWNSDTIDHDVTCWWSFPHHYWETHDPIYGAPGTTSPANSSNLSESVHVTAGESRAITYDVPVVSSADRLWVNCFADGKTSLGTGTKGIFSLTPSILARVVNTRGADPYLQGEVLDLSLSVTNQSTVAATLTVDLKVFDAAANQIGAWQSSVPLGSKATAAPVPPALSLPGDLVPGKGWIELNVLSGTSRVAGATAPFTTAGEDFEAIPTVTVDVDMIDVAMAITNRGFISLDNAELSAVLKGPDGFVQADDALTFSVPAGASSEQMLSLPLEALDFGDHTIAYTLTGKEKVSRGVTTLRNDATLTATLEATSYSVSDTPHLELEVLNSGDLYQDGTLEIAVAALGVLEQNALILAPGDHASATYDLDLDDALEAGSYGGTVSFLPVSGGEALVQAFTVVIAPYRLEATLPSGQYGDGTALAFLVRNDGGSTATVGCDVELTDAGGMRVMDEPYPLSIQRGQEVSFETVLPAKLVDGSYTLGLSCRDKTSGRSVLYRSSIISIAAGLNARLTVSPETLYYQTGQTGAAVSSITGSALENARLRVELSQLTGDPRVRNYRRAHVGESVQAVAVDANGNRWFGTTHGLTRLGSDGKTWSQFSAFEGLAGEAICGMAMDQSGARWFAFSNVAQVTRLSADDREWQSWTLPPEAGADACSTADAMATEGDTLWLVDGVNTYRLQADDTFKVYKALPAVAVAVDSHGTKYLGGYGFVRRLYVDGTQDVLRSGTDFNALTIAIESDDIIWFGDLDGKVHRYDATASTAWMRYELSTTDDVLDLALDDSGDAWAATPYTVYRLHVDDTGAAQVTAYPYSTDLKSGPGSDVRGMAVDAAGYRWFATGAGASRLSPDGSSWLTFNAPSDGLADNQILDIATDPGGTAWFATNFKVSRLASDGKSWVNLVPPGVSDTLRYDDVAVDPDGNQWLGARSKTGEGKGVVMLAKGDGSSRTYTYASTNKQLLSDTIYDIETDSAGFKWFATNKGVSRLAKDNGSWTTYTSSGCLPTSVAPSVYSVRSSRDGTHWFGMASGRVVRVEPNNTTCTSMTVTGVSNFISDFAFDSMGSAWVTSDNGVHQRQADGTWKAKGNFKARRLAIDGLDNVWVATEAGLRVLEAAADTWRTYGIHDGLTSASIRSVAVDSASNVWAGTDAGISQLSLVTRGLNLIREFEVPIESFSGGTLALTTLLGSLEETGEYFLGGTLFSAREQVIAVAEQDRFYVTTQGQEVLIALSTDDVYYRPGEVVDVTARLTNIAGVPLQDIELLLFQDDVQFYSDTLSLETGGSTEVTATVTAAEDFTLKASARGATLEQAVDVREAEEDLEWMVDVPDPVGLAPFDVSVDLTNSGLRDLSVSVELEVDGSARALLLGPGESARAVFTTSVVSSTTLTVLLRGDVVEDVSIPVRMGEGAAVTLAADAVVPDGPVTVPFSVENTGELDSALVVAFRLAALVSGTDGEEDPGFLPLEETLTFQVSPGERVDGALHYDLEPGLYRLTAAHAFGQAETAFEVLPAMKVEVVVSAGLYDAETGTIPVVAEVSNTGYGDLAGDLQIETDFLLHDVSIELAGRGGSLRYELAAPVHGATGGVHPLTARVSQLGAVLAQATTPIEVPPPRFEIDQTPDPEQSFDLGEEARMSFLVRNAGASGGMVSLTARTLDLLDDEQNLWLEPGESGPLTFVFVLPDDLPAGDYPLTWQLEDAIGEVSYHVRGIDVGVVGRLDKPVYTLGDTALLSIEVENRSSFEVNLLARVSWAAQYDATKAFALGAGASTSLSFEVPITRFEDAKLNYGIYLQDGRSLYIDALYIHAAGDEITLYTDQQVYDLGATVQLTATTQGDGPLLLSAPGLTGEYQVTNGRLDLSFILPSDLVAGTYYVDYSFAGKQYRYPFDVRGYLVRVLECVLDRDTYAPEDTLRARFRLNSNLAVEAYFIAWLVDPAGKFSMIRYEPLGLSEGDQSWEAMAKVTGTSAGTYILRYAFYIAANDTLLVNGDEYFDLSGGALFVNPASSASPADGSRERPYLRIRDALAVAQEGDTIYVSEGTLKESVNFDRSIDLNGGRHPTTWERTGKRTLLEGDGTGPLLTLTGGVGRINGFELRGGAPAVLVDGAGVTLDGLWLEGNLDAIRCVTGAPAFWNSVLRKNGDGLVIEPGCAAEALHLTVTENTGDGLRIQGTGSAVRNSLITDNVGSGVVADETWLLSSQFSHNDVWDNSLGNYGGSNQEPTGLEGNLSVDPGFYEAADVHLAWNSPIIDLGATLAMPVSDFEGESRPFDTVGVGSGTSDPGADELVDSDYDEMPDYWEQKFFLGLQETAVGDMDGDGWTNLEEYRAHTDPGSRDPLDRDGDGFVDGEDCDDSSVTVYPGASETCNRTDDDCDGSIDEDAADSLMWYADADGDGYGAGDTTQQACQAPQGYVTDGTDCDDLEPSVNPGAAEVPGDDMDNDCDGIVDEGSGDDDGVTPGDDDMTPGDDDDVTPGGDDDAGHGEETPGSEDTGGGCSCRMEGRGDLPEGAGLLLIGCLLMLLTRRSEER